MLTRPLVPVALAAALIVGVTASASAAAPACATSQLRLKLGPDVSEKTEQHTALFVLTNLAPATCSLEGYPSVALTDAGGRLLPFAYGQRGDQMVTAALPGPVHVPGGGSVYFALNKNACVSFTRRVATEIRVRLPNGGAALSLRLPHDSLIDYCPAGDPGDGITISPIEATPAAVACRSQRACGPGVDTSAGSIVGTTRLPLRDDALFAASGDSLFLITFPEQHASTITVERLGSGGVRWRRLPFPLAYYLMDVTVGPKGLYAGTSVIKRFTNVPDVLLRIDPVTLAVRARASFPASVATVESGGRMWASIGDGRVVRLDPSTLRILATRRFLTARSVAMDGYGISPPAFGLGSLWVIVGGAKNAELVRMDPATLAVRSRTSFSREKPLSRVIGDARHVFLVDRGIAAVDAHGTIGHLANANLDGAAIFENEVVGLNDAADAIELLDAQGHVVASTPVLDLGGEIAVSGGNAWFLGNGGGGNGIVHVRLGAR